MILHPYSNYPRPLLPWRQALVPWQVGWVLSRPPRSPPHHHHYRGVRTSVINTGKGAAVTCAATWTRQQKRWNQSTSGPKLKFAATYSMTLHHLVKCAGLSTRSRTYPVTCSTQVVLSDPKLALQLIRVVVTLKIQTQLVFQNISWMGVVLSTGGGKRPL